MYSGIIYVYYYYQAGLKTGPLDELKDPTVAYLRLNLPLDPLQDFTYLDDLCFSALGKYFLTDARPKESVLTKQARGILHSLWITTFGIPRAIELLFDAISSSKQLLLKDEILHSDKADIIKQLDDSIRNYFDSFDRTNLDIGIKNYKIDIKNWQRICLEASLCIQKSPSIEIP